MPYLVGAIVLVGLVAVLNLALTFVLIGRMRALAAARPGFGGFDEFDPDRLLADLVGKPLFDVTAAVATTHAELSGARLVALLSTTCSVCRDEAPAFAERASRWPGGPDEVLAVIKSPEDPAAAADLSALLSGHSRVVVDETGEIAATLGVDMFPVFLAADADGRISAAALAVANLPAPAPVGVPAA
jgi:hypothetical protein